MLSTKFNSGHLRLYTGQESTKTFSNSTRVARLASNTLSPKEVNHCSLTLHQSYHGTRWQQTCLRPKNSKYLLLVDYYSRLPVLCKLGSTTSKVLVQEMKVVFAELGVPNVIVSDGGPQYTSVEFKDFTKYWQIEHRVSSSRNPQSNCMEEGEDMDLALLTYNTTPLSHRLPLPAELLNSRKYKTTHLYSTNKTAGELQKDHGPR